MKRTEIQWVLTHTSNLSLEPTDPVQVNRPEEVQLSYGRAMNYEPYTYGLNFKQYDWMEKEYFIYDSDLSFSISGNERAFLYFESIDYKFSIIINNECVADGEGIFTPLYLDISKYSGSISHLKVIVFPIPSHQGEKAGRAEARYSCKPPSSYGWDWHPRLIPSGIIGKSELIIADKTAPLSVDASYRLSDDYSECTINVTAKSFSEGGFFHISLADPEGRILIERRGEYDKTEIMKLAHPRLWFPRTYGDQPIYILKITSSDNKDSIERKIGFRRSKLVRNYNDVKRFDEGFPKTSLPAPATLEINGIKIFAKGSNWVNAEIFPSLITEKRLEELLKLAYDANINILRLWGGQYINKECFYDLCDKYGIMIWQEFMLSCNNYPDDTHYLSVLEKEASTIIRRLRTHPSLAFWAGGNELFNSWSGMTCQSHALRLLDKLCYELDQDTPFNMTSPIQGMGHGTYVKSTCDKSGKTVEFIQILKKTDFNTYTEFGCNGGAKPEYIKKYIMDETNYLDCRPENEIWKEHHAFEAWGDKKWLGIDEVEFYFGKYSDIDDLMDKTLYLQNMTYKTMFEEMRRHWPNCSMAVNWDYNEPWPCAAGNSLINWPCEPKEAYYAVKEALRPTLLSVSTEKNMWKSGETFVGTIWILNDSQNVIPNLEAKIELINGDNVTSLGKCYTPVCNPRSNSKGSNFTFIIPENMSEKFSVTVKCKEYPEYNSSYSFVCKK